MQKDENQGWDLFEDLAEKTIQWEPTSEKPRNSQFIASKGGLLSLESSIAAEVKIATLMRRIEALETKEPANVNQSTHHQFTIRVVHTVRHRIMSLKSALFFIPSKCHRNTRMWPTHGRRIIPTRKHTIQVGRITQISLEPRTILSGLISPTIFTILLHHLFPVKPHLRPPKALQWKRKSVNWRSA